MDSVKIGSLANNMIAERVMDILGENQGMAHHSLKEAYGRIKAPAEDAKEIAADIEKAIKDLWKAAKANDDGAFAVVASEINRKATALAIFATEIGAMAKIGVD